GGRAGNWTGCPGCEVERRLSREQVRLFATGRAHKMLSGDRAKPGEEWDSDGCSRSKCAADCRATHCPERLGDDVAAHANGSRIVHEAVSHGGPIHLPGLSAA